MGVTLFAFLTCLMLIGAGISPTISVLFASGYFLLPFANLPIGILGSGVAGEADPLEAIRQIKSKHDAIDAELAKRANVEDHAALKAAHEALKVELEGFKGVLTSDSFKNLESILTEQGEELNKLKTFQLSPKSNQSFGELVTKAIADNFDKIKSTIEAGGGMFKMEVKAAGTMTITGNYSGGTVGLSTLEPGFTRVQRRMPFLRQIVNVANTISKFITWIEQANPDPGEAGTTAEGTAKTQTDFDVVETSMEVKKITAYIKISKEMVADLPFMQGEVNGELVELVNLKLDEQILLGSGLTTNLKGITEYAPAFDAGSLANTIAGANNFDVLRVAIMQIALANFNANYILMNPEDTAAMDLTKDGEGRYLMPPFTSQNGMVIKGIPIIENNGVPAGEYFVGDFTKSNLRIREDVNIQVGYENDDFTLNLFTVLAELRAVHYIKTNHINAFVHGTFTDDAADLESGI